MASSEFDTSSENSSLRQQVTAEAEAIRDGIDRQVEVAILTDPALTSLAEELENPIRHPFGKAFSEEVARPDDEDFPDEDLLIGRFESISVAVMRGRHLYHGFSPQEAALPVRVLATLGVERFVMLGRAVGLSPRFHTSDVMFVTDHLNLQGVNPLTGANEPGWGPRFPDMSAVYDEDWRTAVRAELGGSHGQGIYAAVPGPAPATPAEQTMLHRMGADAVGTGLVPEVLAARHMERRVLAAVVLTEAGSEPREQQVEREGQSKLDAIGRAAVRKASD